MSVETTLDGRVTMDPAAFARFCEFCSISWCSAVDGQYPGWGWGNITIDAGADKIMLEASGETMRNLRLIPDLQQAAQAGEVDGAFMIACGDGETNLEAVVFRNSDTWAGNVGCLNSPVDVVPVEHAGATYRVTRNTPLKRCRCGGLDKKTRSYVVCRNDGLLVADHGRPVVDIAEFMPPRATGQLEQALFAASRTVGPLERRELGRIAWNATGRNRGMFRRWLETFPEATGGRYALWVPDLFGTGWRLWVDDAVVPLDFRPVCANTDGRQRGQCPVFLVSDTATHNTIRVPAHVDDASLADAAKLAAGGADPGDAVAIISAITNPDQA